MYKHICLFISFISVSSSVWAETDKPVPPMPPALVSCKSESDCDRNAEHLEAFVARFYEWYVESRGYAFLLGRQHHARSYTDAQFQKNNHDLQQLLTPHLWKWYKKAMSGMDGQFPSPYCIDPDAEPILCQFTIADQWESQVSAKFIGLNQHKSSIVANLPGWNAVLFPEMINHHYPPYQLSIKLLPDKGAWKIDEIKGPLNGHHSDK